MKNQLNKLICFLGFLLFTIPLTAQFKVTTKDDGLPSRYGDSTLFELTLKPLPAVSSAENVTPFYKNLFIFGDGDFAYIDFEESGDTTHLYRENDIFPGNPFFARAYSTGVYGGGTDPPPNNFVPNNPTTIDGKQPVNMVASGRYLNIIRNVEVKPGGRFVNIISVKNPNPVESEAFMSGQLIFLYDGKMRVIPNKRNAIAKGQGATIELVSETTDPGFSKFDINEHLFYRSDVAAGSASKAFVYENFGSLAKDYQSSIIFTFDDIAPGDEVHYYVDMEGDEMQLSLVNDTTQVRLNFGAVLAVEDFGEQQQEPIFSIAVPEGLQTELSKIKVDSFLNAISIVNEDAIVSEQTLIYEMTVDTSGVEDGERLSPDGPQLKIVDYFKSRAKLVSSHDPNFMLIEACECPEEAELYQLFTTVQCENTGYGPTQNIEIEIKLPPGISADNISPDLISYFPTGVDPDSIRFEKISNSEIRWVLNNFVLFGTPVRGVGDTTTYATIHFNMYSSVKPSELSPMQACIRFDGKSEVICTLPSEVIAPGEAAKGILECGPKACDEVVPSPPLFYCPWWCWLLVILLLIILIIYFVRRVS